MNKFLCSGKVITASSKQEVIKIAASGNITIKNRIKSSLPKSYKTKDIGINSFKVYSPKCANITATEDYQELLDELRRYNKVSKYETNKDCVIVTVTSETKVISLAKDKLSEATKEFYKVMNEGDFYYNNRIDYDFQSFIDRTVADEIQDIVKSSKYLINKCIERRSPSHSIVWDALVRIFEDVKKRYKLKSTVNGQFIKNWFAYNDTDYKTALKKVIEDFEDFREDLRETEKLTKTEAVARVPKTKVKELCELINNDKKVADAIFKDLTENYNCELDYVSATRYLIKTFGQDITDSHYWVKYFKQLYRAKGTEFLCKVLKDMIPGTWDSEISGGSSGYVISYLYKKYIKQ